MTFNIYGFKDPNENIRFHYCVYRYHTTWTYTIDSNSYGIQFDSYNHTHIGHPDLKQYNPWTSVHIRLFKQTHSQSNGFHLSGSYKQFNQCTIHASRMFAHNSCHQSMFHTTKFMPPRHVFIKSMHSGMFSINFQNFFQNFTKYPP